MRIRLWVDIVSPLAFQLSQTAGATHVPSEVRHARRSRLRVATCRTLLAGHSLGAPTVDDDDFSAVVERRAPPLAMKRSTVAVEYHYSDQRTTHCENERSRTLAT